MGDIVIAVKCAPEERLLAAACEAGLPAVELYTAETTFRDTPQLVQRCRRFPLQYAVHAPTDGWLGEELRDFCLAIGARVCTFHDIYFLDDWQRIASWFQNSPVLPCVENIRTVHDYVRCHRRWGFGITADIEHLQLEIGGFCEDAFRSFLGKANHIHLTGYTVGTTHWHSPLFFNKAQSHRCLTLLHEVGYRGIVVSEGNLHYQTVGDFRETLRCFREWEERLRGGDLCG